MPWARLDDRFWRHRKIRRAWREPRAVGLHVMAIAYCAENYKEEGFIDPEWVEDQLPNARERERVVARLVECGLWERFGDGFQIHDFLDYNHSAEKVEEIREARRLAGAAGGKRSGERRRQTAQQREIPADQRARARNIANTALKTGQLTQEPCETCGAPAEMHHDDYTQPLQVRWLCRLHHRGHHAQREAEGQQEPNQNRSNLLESSEATAQQNRTPYPYPVPNPSPEAPISPSSERDVGERDARACEDRLGDAQDRLRREIPPPAEASA